MSSHVHEHQSHDVWNVNWNLLLRSGFIAQKPSTASLSLENKLKSHFMNYPNSRLGCLLTSQNSPSTHSTNHPLPTLLWLTIPNPFSPDEWYKDYLYDSILARYIPNFCKRGLTNAISFFSLSFVNHPSICCKLCIAGLIRKGYWFFWGSVRFHFFCSCRKLEVKYR